MRKTIGLIAGLILLVALTGCSKFTEPYKDAGVAGRNDAPAYIGTMPDGFSNWSAKCDGGNMVYVIYHGDAAYGNIAVVKDDPRC